MKASHLNAGASFSALNTASAADSLVCPGPKCAGVVLGLLKKGVKVCADIAQTLFHEAPTHSLKHIRFKYYTSYI